MAAWGGARSWPISLIGLSAWRRSPGPRAARDGFLLDNPLRQQPTDAWRSSQKAGTYQPWIVMENR